jgi:hypothetical protein
MTGTGEASASAATVQWNVQNNTGPHAGIYRREPGGLWSSIATAQSDASGAVSFVDQAVTPGGRYGYMIAVSSERGEAFGGEVWVDIPTAADVDPRPTPTLALERVRPNPVVNRFTVSFALPSAAPARLELMDVGGRRVLEREVGSLGAGAHHLEMGDAHELQPGTYFVRIAQAGRSVSQRVVIHGGGTR